MKVPYEFSHDMLTQKNAFRGNDNVVVADLVRYYSQRQAQIQTTWNLSCKRLFPL